MDCSPPSSSVHGISQARILEWVAISFSGGSSWPRDQIHVSCIGRQVLYPWITREAWNISHSQTKLNIQTIRRAEKELEPVTQIPAEKEKHSLSLPHSPSPFLSSLSLCVIVNLIFHGFCVWKFVYLLNLFATQIIFVAFSSSFVDMHKVVKIWVMRSQLRSN